MTMVRALVGMAVLMYVCIASNPKANATNVQQPRLSLQQQQCLAEAGNEIGKGYFAATKLLPDMLQGKLSDASYSYKRFDEIDGLVDIAAQMLLQPPTITLVGQPEKNQDGSTSMRVEVGLRLLGAGGTIGKVKGFLTMQSDGAWRYTHESAKNAGGEVLGQLMKVASGITITGNGFAFNPPAVRGSDKAGPTTKSGTSSQAWQVGPNKDIAFEFTVTDSIPATQVDKDKDRERFKKAGSSRPKGADLHVLDSTTRYLKLKPGSACLFRIGCPNKSTVFLWVLRDDQGQFFTSDPSDNPWKPLVLGTPFTWTGESGPVKWSLELVRPTTNNDEAEVDYTFRYQVDEPQASRKQSK